MRALISVLALLSMAVAGCGGSRPATRPDDRPVDTGKPTQQPAANPDDPDAALAEMEAASERQKDSAQQRERESEAEARRRAEEETRKKEEERKRMEVDKKGLEGLGTREGQGDDKPLFEERWADVISKVRAELQKYKRW